MNQNIKQSKFICNVSLLFNDAVAVTFPLYNEEAAELGIYQTLVRGEIERLKVSRDSFSFVENFIENRAGGYYQQRVNFKLKNTSEKRSINKEKLRKVKFIKLCFSDNTESIIGLNDIEQNIKPQLEFTSDENFTEVSFSVNSLFPISDTVIVSSQYTFNYPFFYF